MRIVPTVLCLGAATALFGCAKTAGVTPSKDSRGQVLVRSLADPAIRDVAYCDLLSLGLYHRPADAYPETCKPVTEVVTAPQRLGPPLLVVFWDPDFEIEREPVRRGPAGPFTIFDSNGYIVPVYFAANMVLYETELFSYSPRGEIAIGHVFASSSGSSFDPGHWSVQTLHVVTTTVSQKPSLSVAIGPPTFGSSDECAGNFWSWRYRDVDGEGFPAIQIGPRTDAARNITPAATFRWSDADQRYTGPNGSIAEQFLQFRPEDRRAALKTYAEAWRGMPDKRSGYRLSWCRSLR